jgi:hypothetical protein
MASLSKAWPCGCSLAGTAVFESRLGHGCSCYMLYSSKKGTSQDNQEKETSRKSTQIEDKVVGKKRETLVFF